jgi:hypothetical protein
MFEFVDDVKEIFNNINFFTPIYSGAGVRVENIEFSEKYKVPAERADRKTVTNIKNSARPQPSSKRRKLIRL